MTESPERVAILGATSAIAEAAARIWAGRAARLALVGRNAARVEAIAADLRVRGATQVETFVADCAEADATSLVKRIVETLGGLDVALLAYGVLGDQAQFERDPDSMVDLMRVNFVSAVAWCQAIAAVLERQRSGALLVIGSVAGDRGRRSNYVYGASKAGLGVFVEGVAHRLAQSGARAVLIKPGLVDTPMTAQAGRKSALWARPETVARTIVASTNRGGPVVYAPWFWRAIMLVVRNVPSAIFHKTQL
jgi:decaprenylphospho-beta-D-erythro-pentofuranosid-2-ulose 2-reductase